MESTNFNPLTMEEVTVVPDVHAGGSLSTYAYQHMKDPIVVEHITVPKRYRYWSNINWYAY